VWKSILAALIVGGVALPATALDEALYAEILARHAKAVPDKAGTRVDYAALKGSADWQRLIDSLAASDPESLGSANARLAFWINAYNILAIDMVLRGYPVESIRDRGTWLTPVWNRPAGRVGGRKLTLHQIEHEILRPMGDPRIHAAIVCASTSCPSLRREPFRATDLDAQLYASMRRFLGDRKKGLAIDDANGRVVVSQIFSWFAEDFGGPDSVLDYVVPFLEERERNWLTIYGDDAPIAYFEYDWALNDVSHAPR